MNRTMRYLITTLGLALAVIVGLTPVQALANEVTVSDAASLKQAIVDAADGDTIKLDGSFTVDEPLMVNKNLTIDLGNNTLTSTADGNYAILVYDKADLVIKGDGGLVQSATANRVIDVRNDRPGTCVGHADGSGVTIGSGATVAATGDNFGVVVWENGRVTVADGGTVTAKSTAIAGNGSSYADGTDEGNTKITVEAGGTVRSDTLAVYQPQDGTLDISGTVEAGTETEPGTAVYAKSGTVNVNEGATVAANGPKGAFDANDQNGCNPTGDAIVLENNSSYTNAPLLNVSGGTVASESGSAIGGYNADNVAAETPVNQRDDGEKGLVTGGSFSDDSFEDFCEEGFAPAKDPETGTFSPAKTVKVSYYDGDALIETVEVAKGEPFDAPEGPSKDGETFCGWYEANGQKHDFEFGIYEDLSLYATWDYPVTFSDGPTAMMLAPTQHVLPGEYASKPDDPEKDGYVFKYWRDLNGNGPFDFENTPINAATDLIAIFEKVSTPKTCTVTFDTDGGSAVDPVTVDYNTAVEEPKTPTKDGYTFAGWVDANGKTFDFGTLITADTTIKATWEKNADPKPEDKPNNGTTTAPVNTANVPAVTTAAVPNTGDATATGMGLVALVGIVAAGAAVVVRRRTQE